MKQATLQELYNLISEGKGDKTSFHRQALRQFPNLFTAQSSFDQVVTVLMQKQIIAESSIQPVEKTNWFDVFKTNMDIIAEETKAEEKKTSKEVEEDQSKVYKNTGKKSIDNVNGAEFLEGFYLESREEKNANKTVEQIRDIVVKNLSKDPLYYIKDGAFGVKGLGYKEEAPGLGKTKEVTGKYKSSGMEPVKLNESLDEAKEEFWAVERPNGEVVKHFGSEKEAQAWIRRNDPDGMVDYNIIQIEESLNEVDAFDMPTGAMMIQMADNNPSQFKKYIKQMNSDPGFKVQFMKKLSDEEKKEFADKLKTLKK